MSLGSIEICGSNKFQFTANQNARKSGMFVSTSIYTYIENRGNNKIYLEVFLLIDSAIRIQYISLNSAEDITLA